MEYGKREQASEQTPRRRESRQHKSTRNNGLGVGFVLGTILLIGLCTSLMLAGLFMAYVKTTLTPTL